MRMPSDPVPTTPASTGSTAAPGPLGRLADVTFRHRGRTLLTWLVALMLLTGLSVAFKGAFRADYTAPGSDSRLAQDLLAQRFRPEAGDTITVVAHGRDALTSGQNRAAVLSVLASFAAQPYVTAVTDPFTTPGDVAPDGRTIQATIRLDATNPADMPVKNTKHLIALADAASSPSLQMALAGQTIEAAQQGPIGSEAIGLIAAALILLLTFGSVVAAGLPFGVALAGLGVSSALTGLVAALVSVPDWATSLATMIGLGIGIDYALLLVTRFREWRSDGLDVRRAVVATMDTAGRAVVLAGSTVVVSMLGLFAMGLSFMRGAALVTIISVVVVLAAAITLFPALLGYLGSRVDRLTIPSPRRRRKPEVASRGSRTPGWLAWSRTVKRHRIAAAVTGVATLLLVASPFLGVRFGFPDAGNDAVGTTGRSAYELTSRAFGPGANGPLLLVAELPADHGAGDLGMLVTRLRTVPDVAAVTQPQINSASDTAVFAIIPATSPQDPATSGLVHALRDRILPRLTAANGIKVHLGGVTATSIDATQNIVKRIPLLIGGVVVLSMLLLFVAFRSVVVALKAAAMNLLSVAAAYGVIGYVLQGGWFGRLFGIDTPTPLPAFVPVLMFAVLFGLSMDYEVFLVSRMREAWMRTGDNATAIVDGLAGTARVITAAAAIMIAVFAAFIPSSALVLKVIGIGMASAILLDATIVRLLLVPAIMHIVGRWNWWMPKPLGGLPQIHVEGHPERYRLDAASPVAPFSPANSIS